ncbi:hypothetical protein HHK36_015196 [Tetracentron sinense]|uniref:AN1-type domain-containing protein n=1 Tax=Tetracentron sinense TaxID=13715 RepID=A0A835DDM4_TETSI|nr:hypothetical protein HHK36_015196 [Tetracentron sinense]
MEEGTEAFPDLGKHCQHSECNQLDFLPFKCDGCRKVFCLDHRSYKSHECPKPDHNSRKVVVCHICSTSMEITGIDEEAEKVILERHDKSGDCDPSKKKKPVCPVKRCKQILTFSNTNTCKICQQKVCLKHRFPTDHACKRSSSSPIATGGGSINKFMLAFASRNAKDCSKATIRSPVSPSASTASIKAC